jgi:hypothetical protein
MRPTPANSPSVTPQRPGERSYPTVIQIGQDNEIAASTVLSLTPAGIVARPHVGSGQTGRIVLGLLADGSHTVVVAWTRAEAGPAPRLPMRVEERGRVIARLDVSAHVAADIPAELIGIRAAYVIALRVSAGQVLVTVPPEHAIVSLASIEHWMRAAEAARPGRAEDAH